MKEEFSAVVCEELNVAIKGVCTKAYILKDEHKEVIKANSGPAAINVEQNIEGEK